LEDSERIDRLEPKRNFFEIRRGGTGDPIPEEVRGEGMPFLIWGNRGGDGAGRGLEDEWGKGLRRRRTIAF